MNQENDQLQSVDLSRAYHLALPLQQAIEEAAASLGPSGVGLLYGRRACVLARWDGSRLRQLPPLTESPPSGQEHNDSSGLDQSGSDPSRSDPSGSEIDVALDPESWFYEVRVFSPRGELRWLRDPESSDGSGHAVWVTEDAQTLPSSWKLETLQDLLFPQCPNKYLLWGLGWSHAQHPNWSWLAEGRVGALAVPLPNVTPPSPNRSGDRVALVTREYFGLEQGPAGDHGNMTVVEERLIKLEISS